MLWTATTERFSEISIGLNDTADNILGAIEVTIYTDSVIIVYVLAYHNFIIFFWCFWHFNNYSIYLIFDF